MPPYTGHTRLGSSCWMQIDACNPTLCPNRGSRYCWHSYAVRIGDGLWYGNFDIVLRPSLTHSPAIPTIHRPFAVFYLAPGLNACGLGLVIRCCARIGAAGLAR